jgi:hypothetical protein
MKHIVKEELYSHVSGFLASKGVDLKDGSYTRRVQQGCGILADLVNLSQDGLDSAKRNADKQLDKLRQAIHEKTAPKAKSAAPADPVAPQPEAPSAAPQAASTPNKKPRRAAAKKAAPKTTAKRKV